MRLEEDRIKIPIAIKPWIPSHAHRQRVFLFAFFCLRLRWYPIGPRAQYLLIFTKGICLAEHDSSIDSEQKLASSSRTMEASGAKNFVMPVAGILLAAAVGGAVWFSQQQPSSPSASAVPTSESAAPAPTAQASSSLAAPAAPALPVAPAAPEMSPEAVARTVAALNEIDTVLRDKALSTDAAALRLVTLASDSSVPLATRTDALQHAINLLPDESFDSLDPLISTKETPVELLDMVFTAVHDRSASVQLPIALTLMQRSDEDVSTRARNLLAFHLDQDFGDDPAAWLEPVQAAIAKAQSASAPAQAPN